MFLGGYVVQPHWKLIQNKVMSEGGTVASTRK